MIESVWLCIQRQDKLMSNVKLIRLTPLIMLYGSLVLSIQLFARKVFSIMNALSGVQTKIIKIKS